MAANILYSNFGELDKNFASWFRLDKDTLFLYEKLKTKFKNEVMYNHHSELKYFHLTREPQCMSFNEVWKYRSVVSHICETRPMSEIKFPEIDLNWYYLATNPHKCVIDFLKQNRENINWATLSANSSDAAVEFLLEEIEHIDWWCASSNTNEKIIVHFTNQRNNLSNYKLSKNQSDMAVQFLLNNADFYSTIQWGHFCKNPNDIVVSHIITIITENKNDKRIIWSSLCENTNPRVFDILRNNKDKIMWGSFLKNPICFKYNYEMMRARFLPIKEEIESIFLRPENIMAIIERERDEGENDFDVMARLNVNFYP
jgi:hypothetical protein